MIYILGSGSALGPCLSHLVSRDITKFTSCICLKCSRLVTQPQVPERGKSPARSLSSHPRLPMLPSITNNPSVIMKDLTSEAQASSIKASYRSRYPNPEFTEKHFTSYDVPSSRLGPTSPLNVSLLFSVGPNLVTGVSYRYLHTSPLLDKKASSKIEETVIRLKEKKDEKIAEIEKIENLEKTIKSVIEAEEMAVKVKLEQEKDPIPKRGIWEKVKDEAKHYYSGFKLLALDVKISSKIVYKIAQGKNLTRRENRQLVRTVSDLFRLVPFSVFILVPFMELLLPVALKLFPGMLPSTFASADEKENKMRRQLKAKLEYAKFLQKTLDEMGPADREVRSQSASDFVKFYDSVKKTGAVDGQVTNKDILKFSKLFEDEITLDNMTRSQLRAVCALLDLTPIGTSAFLRLQIEMQLRKLQADDVTIAREGVESMTVAELQVACKDRGMRALGLTKEKLTKQLGQWIELSTNEKVPPSLLLLSRTLYLPENLAPEKAIEATISALPETVATGAKAKLGEREGKIENVTRLEIIKQEEAKIQEEEKERAARREEKKKKELEGKLKQEQIAKEALEKAIDETILGTVPPDPPTAEAVVKEATSILRRATVGQDGIMTGQDVTVTDVMETTEDDIHVGRAEVLQESVPKNTRGRQLELELELSNKDLGALRSAIETIYQEKGSKFVTEHEVLHELRQELVDYEEDLGEMQEVAKIEGRQNLKQTKGAARLFGMVNKVLGRADTVVKKLEKREAKLRTDIDSLDKVGVSSAEEEEHLVSTQDLLTAVRGLQQVPDSEMVERITEVVNSMDEDDDGVVKLEHVNKVIEILGSDNVEISAKQIKQILDLIGKEELLEVESRIEKVLGKIQPVEPKLSASVKPPVIEKDLSETSGDEQLVDKAEEMSEDKVEPHIVEMFSRPSATKKTEPELASEEGASRDLEDNSVKDVTDAVKEKEEVPLEKVPQKNGSK